MKKVMARRAWVVRWCSTHAERNRIQGRSITISWRVENLKFCGTWSLKKNGEGGADVRRRHTVGAKSVGRECDGCAG